MFQGGFVGTECEVAVKAGTGGESKLLSIIFPQDINDLQKFAFGREFPLEAGQVVVLRFTTSSDFYGRVTLYLLELYGEISD